MPLQWQWLESWNFAFLFRMGVLEDAIGLLRDFAPPKPCSLGLDAPETLHLLAPLYSLLNAHGVPRMRHLAFMLLMAVGGAPPTLFRERDDEDAIAAPGLPWRQKAEKCPSWDPFLMCTVLLSCLTQSSRFSQLVRFVTIGSIEACIALIG